MKMEKRPDWEKLVDKYQECRCFIEYAYENYEDFQQYIISSVQKLIMGLK